MAGWLCCYNSYENICMIRNLLLLRKIKVSFINLNIGISGKEILDNKKKCDFCGLVGTSSLISSTSSVKYTKLTKAQKIKFGNNDVSICKSLQIVEKKFALQNELLLKFAHTF